MRTNFLLLSIVGCVIATMVFAPAAFCNVKNTGNLEVQVTFFKKDGTNNSHVIYPDEEISLPSDVVQVRIDDLSDNRGDEDIEIRIRLPDGRQAMLQDYGSVFNIPQQASTSPFYANSGRIQSELQ